MKFTDLGIGQLKADLEKLRRAQVTIGWQGESGAALHPGTKDEPVAQVAAWMEHGTKTAPARPSLKTTFDRHGAEFVAASRSAMADLVDGRVETPEAAIERIGEAAVASLRATIDDARSWAEPLAESTAAAKGHDQPLVDTFTMRSATSWAHRENGVIVTQGGEAS